MKKISILLLLLVLFVITPVFANVGISTLQLVGVVQPKSLMQVSQLLGASSGDANAIPLDSGDILPDAEGDGVKVGEWTLSHNLNSSLDLIITYDSFRDPGMTDISIPYEVYNGSYTVSSGSPVWSTQGDGGGLKEESGPIYIKRTDSNPYPPSHDYMTTISLSLVSNN